MILDEIVTAKKKELKRSKAERKIAELRAKARSTQPVPGFELRRPGAVSIIAEVKRASPVKGVFKADLDPAKQALAYKEGGATAISVLTDREFFKGSVEDLRAARDASRLPILRKDFVIDDYQLWEAKVMRASAALGYGALFFAFTLTLIAISGATTLQRLDRTVATGDERTHAYALIVDAIGEAPVLGTGAGTFQWIFTFFRDDKLDALNYFDKKFDREKPDFRRQMFGGSVGGPVVRDKMFFFGSYEGLREDYAQTDTATVLSANARQGRLANGKAIAVNPAIQRYVNLYPVPGQGNTIVQDFGDRR